MATISRNQVYKYLKDFGATAEEATVLTTIADLESGFDTEAKNPNSTASGIFQFLEMHFKGKWNPFDPKVACQKALELFRSGGGIYQLGSAGAGHWEALTLANDGNTQWQRRWEASLAKTYAVADQLGDQPKSGTVDELSGLSDGGASQSVQQAGPPTAANPDTAAVDSIPEGYDLFEVDGKTYLAFEIGNPGAQVTLFYEHTGGELPPGTVTRMSEADWRERVAGGAYIDAGTTAAFEDLNTQAEYGDMTYQERYESVLWEMGLYGTDALQSQQVMNVIGLMLSRPDMSPEEFKNRLAGTDWAQARTDLEKAWNDKSAAQQDLEILEQASSIAGLYFTYLGKDLDLSGITTAAQLEALQPRIYQAALNMASGKTTQQILINTWLKEEARKDPESPWSRRVRAEEAARGEHDVAIEDEAKTVQDLYYQYGLPITTKEAKAIGEKLVMNQMSFLDVQESVRDQAEALYPHKPREVATRTWAQPYASTMAEMWEISDLPDLEDPTMQRALTDGQSLGDFRRALKKDERWLTTKNARDETHGIISELGRRFGY